MAGFKITYWEFLALPISVLEKYYKYYERDRRVEAEERSKMDSASSSMR